MRYDEAVEILQSKDVEVEWGQDLDYSKEKILTADFDVTSFPYTLSTNRKTILS